MFGTLVNLEYLWGLIIIPIVILLITLDLRRKKQLGLLLDSNYKLSKKKIITPIIVSSVLFLLIVAWSRPLGDLSEEEFKKQEYQFVFLLDNSTSMLATDDSKSNRFEKGKVLISQTLQEFPNSKAALILFNDQALSLTPITSDLQLVTSFLESAKVKSGSTNINLALKEVFKRVNQTEGNEQTQVVLISDGEFQVDIPDSELASLNSHKIQVHTIGIGSEAGSKIILEDGSFLKYQGEEVISTIKPDNLELIAQKTNGKSFILNSEVNQSLNSQLIKGSYRQTKDTQLKRAEQYQWFILVSFCFLLLI